MMIASAKWKKIKMFTDSIYKTRKKEIKEKLVAIEEFCQVSEANRLLYISNYIFIPCEAIMDTLILKAATESA
jgi:hypothetical protein